MNKKGTPSTGSNWHSWSIPQCCWRLASPPSSFPCCQFSVLYPRIWDVSCHLSGVRELAMWPRGALLPFSWVEYIRNGSSGPSMLCSQGIYKLMNSDSPRERLWYSWLTIYANNWYSIVLQAWQGESQPNSRKHLGIRMEQLLSQIPSTTSVWPGLCLFQTGDSLFWRHVNMKRKREGNWGNKSIQSHSFLYTPQ